MSRSRPPAIIVLAHAHDTGARAVAQLAQARGRPVRLLRPGDLAAARWNHAIDARGRATGGPIVAANALLDRDTVGAVLSRVWALDPPAFARAPARTRAYAGAEMRALIASWLEGLRRPVINPPATLLGGPSRRRWLARAASLGIPVARELVATSARLLPPGTAAPRPTRIARRPVEFHEAEADRPVKVLVTGDRSTGPVSLRLRALAVELAADQGHQLLELALEPKRLRLIDVDPAPPLLGDRDAEAVADMLDRVCCSAP